jgi:hypothetical protein
MRLGYEILTHYFSCSGGPGAVSIKITETQYVELMFLYLIGYVGHVVHSSVSGVRNIDTLFFILWWAQYRFQKSTQGHVTLNLCFCIRWDVRIT